MCRLPSTRRSRRPRHPHPCLWGAFARALGRYARDVGLFSLETAVHKMTGLSAEKFGLTDRGVIREGAYAGLTLFDPVRIADRGTFEDTAQRAAGIEMVLDNSTVALEGGRVTGARPGRALRRAV